MELFHEKERYLQEILGSNINHKVARKIITNQIDERASRFIRSLNYAFMSYRDKNGFPQVLPLSGIVITSYSIHYTKLYDCSEKLAISNAFS